MRKRPCAIGNFIYDPPYEEICKAQERVYAAYKLSGAYHGKDGFDAFSHYKSVMDKKTWLDLPMRYQPYKNRLYEKLLHMFLK